MINYYYDIQNDTKIKPTITYVNNSYFDKKIVDNYKNSEKLFLDKKKLQKKNSFFNKITKYEYLLNDTNYLFEVFNIDILKSGLIRADYINDKLEYYVKNANYNTNIITNAKYKLNNLLSNKYIKYNTIIQNEVSKSMYDKLKDLSYCNRQNELINDYYLTIFISLFDVLEINGNLFFSLFSICDNEEIDIIYLLSYMFDNIIIYNGLFIYCQGFRANNSLITKEDIIKIKKNGMFCIEPKEKLNDLISYYNNIIINKTLLYNLYIDNKYDEYIDTVFISLYNNIINRKINENIKHLIFQKMITFLKRIYINNSVIKINSSIKNSEGHYLSEIISNNNYKKCLEIGFAFGISAFYILSNKNSTLISIDPNQITQWKSMGSKLIKSFKFNKRHKLIVKKSYEALPELLKKHGEGSFDFIFIDGWHTFDYTLVDFFYSNLLLKIGGIIVIDDAIHPGVADCVTYLTKNYNFYEKLNSPNTVASYKKIKNDDREWNFHVKI